MKQIILYLILGTLLFIIICMLTRGNYERYASDEYASDECFPGTFALQSVADPRKQLTYIEKVGSIYALGTSVKGSKWSLSQGYLEIRPGIGLIIGSMPDVNLTTGVVTVIYAGTIKNKTTMDDFLMYDCDLKIVYDEKKSVIVTPDGKFVNYTTTPGYNERFETIPVKSSPPLMNTRELYASNEYASDEYASDECPTGKFYLQSVVDPTKRLTYIEKKGFWYTLDMSAEGSEFAVSKGYLTIRPGIGLNAGAYNPRIDPFLFSPTPVKYSSRIYMRPSFLIYDCNSKTIYDYGKQILVSSDGSIVEYTSTPSENEQFDIITI